MRNCPSVPGSAVSSQEEQCAQPGRPVHPALVGASHQLVTAAGGGHQGQTPLGPPQPPPAMATVWNCPASLQGQRVWVSGLPFVCPCSEWRKVLSKAGLLCSHRRTHIIPNQGLCLVYLSDVLPEQMGRGNDSPSHFCLHCTLAHPSFSHLASPGRHSLH